MKRFALIAMSVLLIASLLLAGCGKAAGPEGKYITKSVGGVAIKEYMESALEGTGFTLDEYLEILEMKSLEDFMTVEIKEGGTATVTVYGEEPDTGTWTRNGDTIVITVNGEAQDFKLNGNELSTILEGLEYVFVKK